MNARTIGVMFLQGLADEAGKAARRGAGAVCEHVAEQMDEESLATLEFVSALLRDGVQRHLEQRAVDEATEGRWYQSPGGEA